MCVAERRGTLGPTDSTGRRLLIVPGGVMRAVSADATDDEIKAEFALDHLVHSPRVVHSPTGGVCLDGPAAGTKLDHVTNELDAVAVDFDGSIRYRVTALGDEYRPAELRHIPYGEEPAGRVAMHVRFTRVSTTDDESSAVPPQGPAAAS